MQMQIARQVAGEAFEAALTVASEIDADLRVSEIRGAFLPIKEDSWQEVGGRPHQGIAALLDHLQLAFCLVTSRRVL